MIKIFSTDIKRFPPVTEADENGLVAIGGSYTPENLLKAYKNGIFPWFDETLLLGNRFLNLIHWYSPDPRFVLFKEDFRIGKRILRYFNKSKYKYTFNKAFEKVIKFCKLYHSLKHSTWISDEMIKGYLKLFKLGFIKSVEVWDEKNNLVGGLYGVNIGKYFCGESMFSLKKNASKFAFITLANNLFYEKGYSFIDCQVYSVHLSRFGAINIPRNDFLILLKKSLS